MKPRLLDLFCGAGGAAMGYHRAGFDVVGVDRRPQPNYPFEFVQADALLFLDNIMKDGWYPKPPIRISDFDAIHASPPCPAYSTATGISGDRTAHPDLVGPVRELLEATGLPYVIENVIGAPVHGPILCGAAFALGADCADGRWRPLKRHRRFETNWFLHSNGCACNGREPIGRYGGGTTRHVGRRGYVGDKRESSQALGIDWMTVAELTDAIPPAYTQFIGEQLLAHVQSVAA